MEQLNQKNTHQHTAAFWTALITSSLLLVVIILGVVLYAQGGLLFSFARNDTASSVCDVSVVQQYNKILEGEGISDTDGDLYRKDMIDFGQSVRQKAGYEKDSTCLYISARTALEEGDYTKADAQVALLATLIDKGQYINSRVLGLGSLQQLEGIVKAGKARAGA